MGKAKKHIQISKELSDAGYKVCGNPLSNHFVSNRFGEINLNTMKPSQAEILLKNKFPYLEKVKAKESK